jgi:hypothetical protein
MSPADNTMSTGERESGVAAADAVAGGAHTPGPWVVEHRSLVSHVYTEGGADDDLRLADVHQYGSATLPRQGREANARLIAAAPELLEFARAHEAWEAALIRHGRWEIPGAEGLPALTDELYDAMMELQAKRNAVILKAEGRSC